MPRSHKSGRMLRAGAFLCLTIVGCAPVSASSRDRHIPARTMEISQAEIDAASPEQFATAYDIVRVLRPSMFLSRGVSTERSQSYPAMWEADHGIKVYLDGFRYGGLASLAMIPAAIVQDVRWLSAADATTRYGTGNVAGAIVITTRTGRR